MPDITPVMDVGNKNDGNNWTQGLVGGVLGFLAGSAVGGGGLFNRGASGANANTVIGLTNEGLNLAIQRDLNQIAREQSNQICDGFHGIAIGQGDIKLELCRGFGALTHQIDMGFCDVKQTVHADGMATRALINDLETQRLRERLLAAENALNNANQTAAIVGAIRPYPTPAFIAPNPAAPFDGHHGFGHKWA